MITYSTQKTVKELSRTIFNQKMTSSKTNVVQVTDIQKYNPTNTTVLYFYTTWHEPCVHLHTVFQELSIKYPQLQFYSIDAEELEDLSLQFDLETVPTFVVLKDGKEVERYAGQNAPAVTALIQKYSSVKEIVKPVKKQVSLDSLVKSHPIMIFIKGTPSEPRCGFSKQAIALLNDLNVEYGSFDILADEDVRQGLKAFSEWPTFPQIYVNGEFIGGLDILKEMINTGEFQKMIPDNDLNTRLKNLINREKVMLFMKGSPDTPKCGFSRVTVQILNDQGVKFGTFDILGDEEVRQGLKEYSDWPTYPQLYIDGELVGGLDILKELVSSGEFSQMVNKL